jgi:glutamine---fructose-6-phosphate transaminase (isomerizing)
MKRISAVMDAEFREAAAAVERQSEALAEPLARLVSTIARRPPRLAVTCARGSSAHAATFAKYLIERHCGLPVAAAAPSIATLYRRRLAIDGQLFIAISQSGRSDDLLESAELARASGAITVAIVNDTASPLAAASQYVLPISAGPERSVAATKTFVASAAACLRLIAHWTESQQLIAACSRLPDRLAQASDLDWREAVQVLAQATSCVTIGRGPTLAIAREAALKLKEICDLHAEAFSSAEFRHGPIALVVPQFPIFLFKPGDEAAAGVSDLTLDVRHKGARVLVAQTGEETVDGLPALTADHPDADAICLIQSFYGFIVRLAELRGRDADRPRHLQKVTRTR